MSSMSDLRRRIKGINNTKQITKAMNLVASAKLTKARKRFDDNKLFFEGVKRVISSLVKDNRSNCSHFFNQRQVDSIAIIVISGDKGLCAGYNNNVNKLAFELQYDKAKSFITIGAKSKEFFRHKGSNIISSYKDMSENPDYEDAYHIANEAIELYTNGEVDEVYLVHTRFISALSNEPNAIRLLPVNKAQFIDNDDNKSHIKSNNKSDENESDINNSQTISIYEPDEETVLNDIIPRYINAIIFNAILESAVCELSARMTAMNTASENASDAIDKLSLVYNSLRQGAVTQEITEIVGGSNALE